MKKILLSFILFLFVTLFSSAQSIIWEHTSPQAFVFLPILNYDNDLIVRGKTNSPLGYVTYTANYDLDGSLVWESVGRVVESGPLGILKNPDGTYIIGDQVRGYSTFNDMDVFLQQLDANGDTSTSWAQTYVIPNSLDQIGTIHLLPGGDIIIAGQSHPSSVFTLRRADNQGNTVWYKQFGKSLNTRGSVGLINRRGSITLLGRVIRATAPPFTRFPYLMEISPNGDSLLGKGVVVFDSIRSVEMAGPANGIIEAANGDYLFTGVVDDGNGQNERSFVARVDSAFNLVWAYEHPLPAATANPFAGKVAELEDGSILFLAGNLPVQSDGFYLAHLTSTGQFISQTAIQSQVCPNSAVLPRDWAFLPDSSIVICGECQGNSQAYIGRWGNLGLPTIATPVSIAENIESYEADLGQSYPNPNTGSATIPYILPTAASRATIELRDLVTGRTIMKYNLPTNVGAAELPVTLSNVAAGVYVYTLTINGNPAGTKKMVLTR